MKNASLLCITLLFLSFACTEESVQPDQMDMEELTLVHSASLPNTGLELQLYSSNEQLLVGYNKLQLLVRDLQSSEYIENASISLMPMMKGMDMNHSAPVEVPVFNAEKQYYESAIVFVMPSGEMGSWSLDLEVVTNQEIADELSVVVEVLQPDVPTLFSYVQGDSKYFVSLVEPVAPIIGMNDFELCVHQKVSMMDWPAVNEASIQIEPIMPAMDHGSPNNVDPQLLKNGHYKGVVNFTMSGHWQVNTTIQIDEQAYLVPFDIVF